MSEIKIKTEARDNLIDEMQALIDASTAENRTETDATWETKNTEVEGLNKEIEMLEKQEALNAKRALKTGIDMTPSKSEERDQNKARERYSVGKAILEYARNGQLTGIEAEMHEEAKNEYRNSGLTLTGIGIPEMLLKRPVEQRADWNTTVGAAALLTAQSSRVSLLAEESVIEKLGARFYTGLDSAFELPKVTKATATFVAEEAAVPDGGATVAKVTLQPRRIGCAQPFTAEYLSQSNPAVTNTVISDLSNAIMRGVNKDAFAALDAATIQQIANSGNLWKDVVNMEAGVEVDNALEGNLGYAMTRYLKATMKTTYKDPGGSTSIWTDADTVNGYSAYSTNWVNPVDGGTSGQDNTMYFGNWDDLIIGQWGGLELIVDNITMAREGMIQVIASALFDSAILNEESFTEMTDIAVTF